MIYCIIHKPLNVDGFFFEPGVYCGETLLTAMANIAETVWVEDDDGAQWYLVPSENDPNSRKPDHTQPFDLKEFLWIKLLAKSWSEISGIEETTFD